VGIVPAVPASRDATPAYTPWTDPDGADHRARDAQRRALESATPAPRAPGAVQPSRTAAGGATTDAIDPARADEMRRQGEREREARRLRGGMAPVPEPMPRIQPDAPPSPMVPLPPRIAVPRPGEPGGPPIALPTCGPAGCFDANGRALPSAGGGVLIAPGGRPCVRTGDSASC
jgi:hypothetical protein